VSPLGGRLLPRLALLGAGAWVLLPGCKPKATSSECDTLIDRYATLVVTETFPDAGADRIKTEQEREKTEARGDDAFKNCSSEVSRAELDCAMHAKTVAAFEKCLE
jgi:hypothetical protein